MTFQPSMEFNAEGLKLISSGKWRHFDGMAGAVLEFESQKGAQTYCKCNAPRIVIHFEKVSCWKSVSVDRTAECRQRPALQVAYIPAGVPQWITGNEKRRSSQLNIYMHKDRLTRYLSPAMGRSAALTAIKSPIDLDEPGSLMSLATLLSEDIFTRKYHPIYAESLVGSIVTSLFAPPDVKGETSRRKLTPAQLEKVVACLEAGRPGRVAVVEMASAVGLSESRFSQVFKDTTGTRPLEWQRIRRIDQVKALLQDTDLPLAEVAYQLGFTDQSHMTKAFKQLVGMAPAAWRFSQK